MGSNPIARSRTVRTRVSAVNPPQRSAKKANAHPLRETVESFLLSKRVGGWTNATLFTYRWWMEVGLLREGPLRDFTMRTFKTLEGVRNRTLILHELLELAQAEHD